MIASLPLYGLVAEFPSSDALVAAAARTREAGYKHMDAYSPFPVEGLAEALGFRKTLIPYVVLLGGIAGGVGGYLMQWYTAVYAYPINSGGKPLDSWPAFVPVTFEMVILVASLFALFGMLALNGLPMPYHPLFNVPRFAAHATQDGFFLAVEASDPLFDEEDTRRFLESLGATEVADVPQ